ncbi:MAG: phage tail tape measure protein [Pseudomonadota bacterium]
MTERTSDDVEELFATVDGSLASTEAVVESFRREAEATRSSVERTNRGVAGFNRAIGRGLRSAFDTLVFDGGRASDALRDFGRTLSSSVLTQALTPVQNAIGSAIGTAVQAGVNSVAGGGAAAGTGATPMAQGGVVTSGRVQAFAKGGIVRGPTTFGLRGGTGLMGEAGPEAIMPLSRGADGKLGVKAAGGGGVHVTMNVSTPDAPGFQRSRGQIAAGLTRVLSRGRRNL